MKKKSRLLLLALLPLLTSCPPSDDSPRFTIKDLQDSNAVRFELDDGVDLTAYFGLYDRSEVFGDHRLNEKYMFLAKNEVCDDYERIYTITDRNKDCFYEYKKGDDGWYKYFYSKEAKLHLDSRFFIPGSGSIRILLVYSLDRDSDEDFYFSGEFSYPPGYFDIYYWIDEDKTVNLVHSADLLPGWSKAS